MTRAVTSTKAGPEDRVMSVLRSSITRLQAVLRGSLRQQPTIFNIPVSAQLFLSPFPMHNMEARRNFIICPKPETEFDPE